MIECEDCKYAIWDYEEYSPCVRHYVVSDCKIDGNNKDGECEDFDEYIPPEPEGW